MWEAWNWHPNADIDHYLTVLRAMPEGTNPMILALYRGNRPVAMLIGRVEDGDLSLRIGYKNLMRVRVRKMVFIYGGLLGECSAENCGIVIKSVNDCLRHGDADLAFFNSLRTNSPLHLAATRLQSVFVRDCAPMTEMHRGMKVPAKADDVYRALSAKVRKNLGWQARKLVKDFSGEVEVRCFREPAELEPALHDVEQVARMTYQRGLGVGFVDAPILRQFLSLQAQKGWLRAYILYIADRPCAFWIGKLYKKTFHSDFMGYNPEYSKYSPGMFLVMNVIEKFADGRGSDLVGEVDFGLGDAQYKAVLGNAEWQESSVYVFAPTLAGLGLNFLRTPTALIDQLAKRYLDKTGLLQKTKRIWRRRVANR
ncbi:MAG: GNAT family N-acetyltransferase [Terriglobales bacterium]